MIQIHQSIEVWVYLRGKQGSEFWAQSPLEHVVRITGVSDPRGGGGE